MNGLDKTFLINAVFISFKANFCIFREQEKNPLIREKIAVNQETRTPNPRHSRTQDPPLAIRGQQLGC